MATINPHDPDNTLIKEIELANKDELRCEDFMRLAGIDRLGQIDLNWNLTEDGLFNQFENRDEWRKQTGGELGVYLEMTHLPNLLFPCSPLELIEWNKTAEFFYPGGPFGYPKAFFDSVEGNTTAKISDQFLRGRRSVSVNELLFSLDLEPWYKDENNVVEVIRKIESIHRESIPVQRLLASFSCSPIKSAIELKLIFLWIVALDVPAYRD